MSTQHTKGPWVENRRYIEKDDDLICEMFGEDISERDANARLIAAAPDLLDALKDAYALAVGHATTYQFQHELGELHPTHQESLDKARAAIAKATGETK
jgi:hypothetical protein